MKHIIILLLLSSPLYGQYKITPKKILTWSTFAVGGSVWGMREAYHADPYVFEKKWRVNPYSFWGSKAWERNYVGNKYHPKAIHKDELFGNFGRDFWHTSGYVSGGLLIGGTFIIGSSKQKFSHKLIDIGIGGIIGYISSFITFKYLI